MAILFYEGFDQFAGNSAAWQAAMMAKGWTDVSSTAGLATTGRYGGSSLYSTVSTVQMRHDFASGAKSTAIQGVALYVPAGWGSSVSVLYFFDGTSVQCGLAVNASRQPFVYRGTSSTVLATSATVLPGNQWSYLEFSATIHNTTGAFEVRLNGTQLADLTMTGQNTRATANNQMTGAGIQVTSTTQHQVDDYYLVDTTGSAPANTFLGEVRVQTLAPSAAGSSTQWTPSTGANYAAVDELGSNPADTDYVSSSTAGNIDLYAIPDLTGSPAVYSVAISIAARKDDVGTRSIRAKLKSGSTTANGTTTAVGSSYAVIRHQWDQNPDGSVAWTPSAINSAEIGVELVA